MITYKCPYCKKKANLQRIDYGFDKSGMCESFDDFGNGLVPEEKLLLNEDNVHSVYKCSECGETTGDVRGQTLEQWIEENQK